jgi:formylglycine-generating enzyme required for sulfatase activity
MRSGGKYVLSAFWAAWVLLMGTVVSPVLDAQTPVMLRVLGGTFWMGSRERAYADKERAHELTVPAFYISETEVTQALWKAVMGDNPSYFPGDDRPVENVTWFDAVRFCNVLSEREGLSPAYTIEGTSVVWDRTADGYRLPSEAEWDYAARGGPQGAAGAEPLERVYYAGGDNPADLGWYDKNSGRASKPVKGKGPNELGLYDMSGNVWEWCWDWYGPYPYDPAVERGNSRRERVLRGGAWFTPVNLLRVTNRYWSVPSFKANSVGFRLARSGN